MTARRGYLGIARDVLTITQAGAGITKIVYDGNLNFHIAKAHLDILVRRGLMDVEVVRYRQDEQIKRWTTTDRGRAFLVCMESVLSLYNMGPGPQDLAPEVVA
jgi:predicted transcriptional regulator